MIQPLKNSDKNFICKSEFFLDTKNWFKGLIFIFLIAAFPMITSAEGLKQEDERTKDFSALNLEDLLDAKIVHINVFGTHTHLADEWMIGYQYMFMEMNGNRTGTEQINKNEVLNNFNVSPLRMSMQMHMLMLMYAASDDLTLRLMAPYIKKEMDHETRTAVRFTTRSEGIGDVKAKGVYTFYGKPGDKHRLFFTVGFSLPTGSIDRRDALANQAQGQQKLPYPMQLGSGTVDFLPGLTYLGETENWAWGAEWMGTVRLGRNAEGYSLGNQYGFSAWGSWKWNDSVAPFIKMRSKIWENIDGSDPELNPATVPTADPNLRGGEQIDLQLGIDIFGFEGHRVAIDAGAPIYQSLDGPQLETDFMFSVGWTYTW